MLALLYLIVMLVFGDVLSRQFFRSVSSAHRLASAFLVGLLLSSWITYLAARLFAFTSRPLVYGNLVFFGVAAVTIYFLNRRLHGFREELVDPTPLHNKRNSILTVVFLILATWMMFSSLNMKGGTLQIANHQWSDFGPNIALMQSFALGHNFPTEYPHFAGDRIRYHFLFYFQAGNLEYLGLNPAWSNNLLSIFSLVSMLVMVMTLGFVAFRSHAVGRIGAALFFFHGSLAYVPFLRSQGSVRNAISAIAGLTAFLPSGYQYRGEDWGMWSLVNFLNQRHFASAIGIFLIVVTFLVDRFHQRIGAAAEKTDELPRQCSKFERTVQTVKSSWSYLFLGLLVGLLPLWNGAVFLAAVAVLLAFLVVFPLRSQLFILLTATFIVALPQVAYLRGGAVRTSNYSFFHWGYTLTEPTVPNVLKYLGYTFGFKWLLIGFALFWMSKFQRIFALAIGTLVAMAFLFQFSEEVLANHKFLNVWLVVANVFVGFGIWRLWSLGRQRVPARIATITLVVLVTLGGLVDLLPIHKAYWAEISFEGDKLLKWTREQTDPKSVFLSDRFVTHQILLAGRRVFFGWPYYSWGAGYRTNEREAVYRLLFEETDPSRLQRLLLDNNISYVAIDDGLRRSNLVRNLNEAVYENHFEKVFQDSENRYGALSIFKVPSDKTLANNKTTTRLEQSAATTVNAFRGGRGDAPGQFASAHGIATDHEGNFYVADTGNARVQKFSADGVFLDSLGKSAIGVNQLREPVGIAIDAEGNVYVADAGSHNVVKFDRNGNFISRWPGPAPGFYGPRDIAVGSQGNLYVVDQGRARIVVMDRAGNTIKEWGKKGAGDGEFDDPTSVAVGTDRVFVADLMNGRIQVFDLNGKFIRKWVVPQWQQQGFEHPHIVFDAELRKLYVSSGLTNEVLLFDLEGSALGSKNLGKDSTFSRPSGLALGFSKGTRRLYVMNTDGANVAQIELGTEATARARTAGSVRTAPSRN